MESELTEQEEDAGEFIEEDAGGNMTKVCCEMFPKGVFKHQLSDGYCLDNYLKSNLDHLKKNVTKQDYDGFIVIDGREGYGKSTLASQIAMYLDNTYNLDRCAFTSEQFVNACNSAKKYQAVVFDETMGYLSSRGAMSKFNRDLIKVMSEMRSKNLFVIMCIPNFFELDKYPALHRSTGLIHVQKRGVFWSYDYPSKKKLYLIGKKFYNYNVSANFYGSFRKQFSLPKDLYEIKKQKAISSFLGEKNKEKRLTKHRDILIRYIFKQIPETNKEEISDAIELTKENIDFIIKNDKEKDKGLKD